MLSIRFTRIGAKKKAFFRVIVTEKSRDPWGKATEILGHYDPKTKKSEVNAERIQYWISKGAQATPSVFNLLVTLGVIKGEKVRASKAQPGKKKRLAIESDKAAEVAKAKTEAAAKVKAEAEAKVAEEAAAKAAEEAKAAAAEPVVEAPVAAAEEAPAAETPTETPAQ